MRGSGTDPDPTHAPCSGNLVLCGVGLDAEGIPAIRHGVEIGVVIARIPFPRPGPARLNAGLPGAGSTVRPPACVAMGLGIYLNREGTQHEAYAIKILLLGERREDLLYVTDGTEAPSSA